VICSHGSLILDRNFGCQSIGIKACNTTYVRHCYAVPHLRASNRKCLATNSGMVNRRLNEAVVAGRAKSAATYKVGNVSEWAKVQWCTARFSIPGRQLWTRCIQEHSANEGWWLRQRHGWSDAGWKSAMRQRWGLTADYPQDKSGGLSRRLCHSLVASLPEWPLAIGT